MQLKAILTVAPACAGKSSFAKEWVKGFKRTEINRDNIRRELFNFGPWSEYSFRKNKEKAVSDVVHDRILAARDAQQSIIISDTNLNPTFRANLVQTLETCGYEVEIKTFEFTYEQLVQRNCDRHWGVDPSVLYKQYQQYLQYIGRKTYTPDENLPKAVWIDVDGTIAERDNRGPFEWSKVGNDKPRTLIINMLHDWATHDNCYIILMSGRDSVCRPETEEWLKKHNVPYDRLFMRAEGDCRPDTVIKEELFWEHVAPNYNVVAAVDDRPCMIRLLYELKIPNVISVANPFVEF